jgi:hypothetical protein
VSELVENVLCCVVWSCGRDAYVNTEVVSE